MPELNDTNMFENLNLTQTYVREIIQVELGRVIDSTITNMLIEKALLNSVQPKLDALEADNNDLDKDISEVSGNLLKHSVSNNNPHQVTKAQVGLGNVDNTADLNKPVSTLAKTYIDQQDALKADKTVTYTKTEVDSKINAVSGGYIGAFATLAELNAKTGMTSGQVAKVMNDTTAINNGDYRYTGSAWVKGYDPLTDAKAYTDTSLKLYVKTYNTLAELNAVTGMTAGQVAKVTNDTTTANIGDYRYSGTAWVKFNDPTVLTNAKAYTDSAITLYAESVKNVDLLNVYK